MNQVVTFTKTAHSGKQGTSKRGPYWFRVFETAGGAKFQTLDVDLGDKVIASFGQQVDIEYEVEKNDQYENNVLKSVKILPSGSTEYIAPKVTENPSNVSTDRELRIMRQSALDRAINTVGHGIVEIEGVKVTPDKINPYDLFRLADTYILYFEAGISAFTPEEVVTY